VATYKLIQDIEAEDKILGPLTLRQFIFGLVAAFFIYLCVFSVTKHAPFLLALFAPPAIFCGFFAFPFGRDQPTEIWFLAKLRFWFLPRDRVWNQSGVKELVTITVPKKVEHALTDGLSQSEVKSRLQALANTIDSRGWAIKNVNAYAQPAMAMGGGGGADDRLIDLSSIPQDVPDAANDADDMMDPVSSPIAHQMDTMVAQSTQMHRKQLIDRLNTPTPVAPAVASSNNWFMGQNSPSAVTPVPSVQATPAAAIIPTSMVDESKLSQQLKKRANSQQSAYGHLRTVRPLGPEPAQPLLVPVPAAPSHTMTVPSDPAILELAGNDDLDVATIARQAKKVKSDDDQPSSDEVVISLR
jgi:hypothetical protein